MSSLQSWRNQYMFPSPSPVMFVMCGYIDKPTSNLNRAVGCQVQLEAAPSFSMVSLHGNAFERFFNPNRLRIKWFRTSSVLF
jgi:hypothetical protein